MAIFLHFCNNVLKVLLILGWRQSEGQVLCIVEPMKLMNEIEGRLPAVRGVAHAKHPLAARCSLVASNILPAWRPPCRRRLPGRAPCPLPAHLAGRMPFSLAAQGLCWPHASISEKVELSARGELELPTRLSWPHISYPQGCCWSRAVSTGRKSHCPRALRWPHGPIARKPSLIAAYLLAMGLCWPCVGQMLLCIVSGQLHAAGRTWSAGSGSSSRNGHVVGRASSGLRVCESLVATCLHAWPCTHSRSPPVMPSDWSWKP
ncbi:hypothetical protein Dimus_035320 [Dionaea muscipula]